LSHTGALAGSDAGARALLRRLGIARVETLTQMLETLKILHLAGPLASNRIASMSCSGGEAGLMSDTAVGDVAFPPLVEAQHRALREALGGHIALANPLDYHTFVWGDRAAIARTFTAMMQGDLSVGVVVADFPRADRCDGIGLGPGDRGRVRHKAATGRPMAILATLPETMPEDVAETLTARGIVPLCGVDDGLRRSRPPPGWVRCQRRVSLSCLRPARPPHRGFCPKRRRRPVFPASGWTSRAARPWPDPRRRRMRRSGSAFRSC
jgi:acyl-CoA synthetase (NDP forming)